MKCFQVWWRHVYGRLWLMRKQDCKHFVNERDVGPRLLLLQISIYSPVEMKLFILVFHMLKSPVLCHYQLLIFTSLEKFQRFLSYSISFKWQNLRAYTNFSVLQRLLNDWNNPIFATDCCSISSYQDTHTHLEAYAYTLLNPVKLNYIHLQYEPVPVAKRSDARTVLGCWNTGIVV
jgi:hypothetical protein